MPKPFVPAGSARNIRQTLDKARPSQIQAGLSWYRRYAAACLDAAATAGYLAGPFRPGNPSVKARRIIGIAAAFSPQRTPNVNLHLVNRFVRDMIAGRTASDPANRWHVPLQESKALAIWNGADPAQVLTGPKERAFYFAAIGDPDQVTIDGHAYAIWIGRRIETHRINVPKEGSSNRLACEADYRAVANEYGISPADVQAITWVAWRDKHQTDKDKARRKFGGEWMAD